MQSDYNRSTGTDKFESKIDKNYLGPSPTGDEEEGPAGRGLSYSNKVFVDDRKIRIMNKVTGEIFEIDKDQARISRLRKRIFSWANSIKPYLDDKINFRCVMITLTYKEIDEWRPGHIRNFMMNMRKMLAKNLVAYAWVAELQIRGAVHYHVLLVVKKGTYIPKPDDAGLWKWGITRIETAKTHFYICSYVGKEYQKIGPFPKGMRMFAVWIDKELITKIQRWIFRLSTLPAWLVEKIGSAKELFMGKWKRNPGGGWMVAGVRFESPYTIYSIS